MTNDKPAHKRKRVIQISLPTMVASDQFLNSLPKVRVNSKVIPIYGDLADEIPFMHDQGIFCPTCPTNVIAELILLGQMKTQVAKIRAYLFLCTACQTICYLPVTKDGEFKITFGKTRNKGLAEISNPTLALFTSQSFDFTEYLMQTAEANYQDVLDKMYTQPPTESQKIYQLEKVKGSGKTITPFTDSEQGNLKLDILLKIVEFGGRSSVQSLAIGLKLSETKISELVVKMVKEGMLEALPFNTGGHHQQLYQLSKVALKVLHKKVDEVLEKKTQG